MTVLLEATGVSRVSITKQWQRYRPFPTRFRVGLPRSACNKSSSLSSWTAGWAGIPEILSTDGDCYGWGRR